MLDNFSDVGGGEELAAIAKGQDERKRERERLLRFLEGEQVQGSTLDAAIENLKKEFF